MQTFSFYFPCTHSNGVFFFFSIFRQRMKNVTSFYWRETVPVRREHFAIEKKIIVIFFVVHRSIVWNAHFSFEKKNELIFVVEIFFFYKRVEVQNSSSCENINQHIAKFSRCTNKSLDLCAQNGFFCSHNTHCSCGAVLLKLRVALFKSIRGLHCQIDYL